MPGRTPIAGESVKVNTTSMGPSFLATMEIPLLMGREFTPQDNQQAPGVAVVNQALAEHFFPNQNPLGQRIILNEKGMAIVGVARDAKYGGIREAITPVVYLPYLQNQPGPPPEMSFAVRTLGDPAAAIAAIRQAVLSIDRNLPLFDVHTQTELIARDFAQERLFATLSSFFGLLALALVCNGLYGVMSYTVTQRTHEIGIRMALGARGGDVVRLVMKETMLLVAGGVTVGLIAALATTRLISSWLYGLTPNDPVTIGLAALVLMTVAAVAGYLPAHRAARVDPLVALRYE